MPYCVECGESVDEGYVFCPNCGAEVDPDSADDGTAEPTGGDDGGGDAPAETAEGGEQGSDDGTQGDDGSPETWGTSSRTAGSGDDRSDDDQSADGQATDAHASATGNAASEPIETADWDETGADTGPAETNVDGPSPHSDGAFSFAIGYPTKRGWESVLIGAVIEFFGMFVPFISLMVRGFGFRTCGAAARGQAEPPEFGEYGEMFIDGFRFAAVVFLWSMVGLFGGGILFVVASAIDEVLGVLLLLPMFLVVFFAVPASLTAYAAHDEIGAAFSPNYAGAFALTGTYVKAWLLFWVLHFLTGIVVTLTSLTVIGFFVAVPWAIYVDSAFWGYYYREAVEAEEKVPPADATPV